MDFCEERIMYSKETMVERVNNLFTYHPPTSEQVSRYTIIRQKYHELSLLLIEECPVSPELSTTITLLHQSSMMANASIAVNE